LGKAADQALERQLAEIRATRAQIESDVHTLTDSTGDMVGTVMGLVGSSGSGGSGGGAGNRSGGAAAAAKDAAPKALAAIATLGASFAAAGTARRRRATRKAQDSERLSARIRSEELARAFGTITPQGAEALVADEPVPMPEPPADTPPAGADVASKGRGRRGLGAVLLIAAAAGAAVWLSGRR